MYLPRVISRLLQSSKQKNKSPRARAAKQLKNSPRLRAEVLEDRTVLTPMISIADPAPMTEPPGMGANMLFTVTLDTAPGATAVSVVYNTMDLTATGGSGSSFDYTPAVGTLTFTGSNTVGTIPVFVHGDGVYELDEQFKVVLSSPTNGTILDGLGIGTIQNNGTTNPPPSLSISGPAATNEGNSGTTSFDFTVTVTGGTQVPMSVDFATSNGTATTVDNDYQSTSGTLNIPASSSSQTLTVLVNGDNKFETNETFTLTLSNPVNASISTSTATATINNDDPQPTIAIDNVTHDEGHSGTTSYDFTVTLSNPSSQTITVNYATANGSATLADNDYQSASGTVTFAPGDTSETVTVLVNGDLNIEGNETFFVNLTSPTNATILDGQGQGNITNDDVIPPVSITDVTMSEGNTGQTTIYTFTATLSSATPLTVNVDYSTADDTATAASNDYVAVSATTLTFSPFQTTKTFDIAVTGEKHYELDETFFVNLSNCLNCTIADGQGVGTIVNDDGPPGISIADARSNEGDGSPVKKVTFKVSLSAQSYQTITVDYATADGTALVADNDYIATSGTITFSPGQTSKSFTVVVGGDTVDEVDETFLVSLSNPVNGPLVDSQAVGTIVNDEISLAIDDVTVTEGDTGVVAATFNVTLSASSTHSVSVDYATAGSSAKPVSDFAAATDTLTFAPGVTTLPVTVYVFGDTANEGTHSFFVNLKNAVNAVIGTAKGTGTILDDDGTPSLSINDVSKAEGNAGTGTTSYTFTVTMSAPSGNTVTVDYATANGTAVGTDYQSASDTLVFLPGKTSATLTVFANGDTTSENNETFFVNLSNASGATIADAQGTGTLLNDDPLPIISIAGVSGAETNSGTKNFAFKVSLSSTSTSPVTVQYATADGTATLADNDYQNASGTLTLTPGQLSKTIVVKVVGDTTIEQDEQFFVNLSSPTNAVLGASQAVGKILNDDLNLSINSVSVTEGDQGSSTIATFTVTLSGGTSSVPVTVNYATKAGGAKSGIDFAPASGTLTFNPGDVTKGLDVVVVGDNIDEGDDLFSVILSNAANATISGGTGTCTIFDDDAMPTISIADVAMTEGNSGTMIYSFFVTLSAVSGKTITVNYATADNTALVANGDYVATSGTLTFTPNKTKLTINVVVNGDISTEFDENFFVNLSNATNAVLSDAQAVGTIVSED